MAYGLRNEPCLAESRAIHSFMQQIFTECQPHVRAFAAIVDLGKKKNVPCIPTTYNIPCRYLSN